MPDFEMPYFLDGGGNKGYFKDSTAREQISDANDQIDTLWGRTKPTIAANTDLNTLRFTAVGEYTTNGNNKNIQNVPSEISNISFLLKTINSLTNETTEINSAWKERVQIIIPINVPAVYIREVNSGSSATSITYGAWRKFSPEPTVNDISSQATLDTTKVSEFNAYIYGKLIYIHLRLKPGVTDQANVVTSLPYRIKGNYGVLPMFFMNAADATSNGVCVYADDYIQYRGSTTSGTSGTMYSGMFFII